MTPLDLAQHTAAPIGAVGAASYFHADTLACGKELGLDGFRFYVLGRGGVLGDVEPPVVSAAFGYFEPGLVAKIWTSAKAIAAPRDAAREYAACAERLGRSVLAGLDGLEAFNAAAEQACAAVDVAALPLFAGMIGESLPDDAPARALRNVMNLRELRGSVHLAAIAAEGLPTAVAHAIRRPNDVELFGWKQPPSVTDDDRARLTDVDRRTDARMAAIYAVLDDAGRDALASGAVAIAGRFAG